MKKTLLLLFALLIFLFAFVSCKDEPEVVIQPNVNNGTASISFNVRNMYWEGNLLTCSRFEIVFKNNNGTIAFTKTTADTSITISNIPAGEYYVHVDGYDNSGICTITSEEKKVTILKDGLTTFSFELDRCASGNGSLSVRISIPEDNANVSGFHYSLFGSDFSLNDSKAGFSDNQNATYKTYEFIISSVPAGEYELSVYLFNSAGEKVGRLRSLKTRIVNTKTSSLSFFWDGAILPMVEAPVFDLAEGIYGEGQLVRISTTVPGAEIHYTTDGTEPTSASAFYVNPIVLSRNTQLKAIACIEGQFDSDITSADYRIKVKNPVFSIKDKSTVDFDFLTITCETADARIVYTTDGSKPSLSNGVLYTSPISIDRSMTVRAVAIKGNCEDSNVVSAEYFDINSPSSSSYFKVSANGAVSINRDYVSSLPSVLIVPNEIDGIEVTSVATNGFRNCSNLNMVVLPNSVTTIGDNAFSGSNSIESIDLSESVTSISTTAFSGWKETQRINDHSGMIKSGSLTNCSAKIYATVKMGTTIVSGYTGMDHLYGMYLPSSVTTIAPSAFSGCVNLEDFVLPDYVVTIGELAFNECRSIESLELPAVLKQLAQDAFRNWSSNQSIVDRSGLLSTMRLSQTSAKIYTTLLPDVDDIDANALTGRDDIHGFDIPARTKSIGDYAFQGTNIESITIPSTIESLGLEIFKGWTDSQRVYYEYNGASLSVSGSSTPFSGCDASYSISIKAGLSSISDNAFYGMKGLSIVDVPATISSIGQNAFRGTSIREVVLPDSVRSIGERCFADCANLISVNLGNSVSSIPSYAFSGCSQLQTIIAPNCIGNISLSISLPLNQLVVDQIDVDLTPNFTSIPAYSVSINRNTQTITESSRVHEYVFNDVVGINYNLSFTLRNKDGQIVGVLSGSSAKVNSGRTTDVTKTIRVSDIEATRVSTPLLSQSSGTYLDGELLEISCPDADQIFYTTDGTVPTEYNGSVYSEPLVLDCSKSVYSVGVKDGYIYSNTCYATYTIKACTPVFSVEPGHTYTSTQTVGLSTGTQEAVIRYTLDGTSPDAYSTEYTGPITISETTTVRAVAFKDGLAKSDEIQGTYTIAIPQHDIEEPVVYSLSITLPEGHQGDTINWGTILNAALDPLPVNVSYRWYLDGELVCTTQQYKIMDSSLSNGYHYIEMIASFNGISCSDDLLFIYNKDENVRICQIGDVGPSGGLVFYDKGYYSDGWRYLEAAPADLKTIDGVPTVNPDDDGYSTANDTFLFGYYRSQPNGNYLYVNGTETYDSISCTRPELGNGEHNTYLLVVTMNTGAYVDYRPSYTSTTSYYAARLCDILETRYNGVVNDSWFLPSKDELNLMYTVLHENGLGNFVSSWYWDSSETSILPAYALCINFSNGQLSYLERHNYYHVRPVHSF